MKAGLVKVMAVMMTATLAMGIVPLPARMLDKAGITMTSEATAYGSEAIVSYSASSVDWATDAGQEPVRALDRNPGTMWRVYRKSASSGGLFIQFSSSQKFAPSFYTFTTAPDAATNPGRNPNSWTLYGQNSGGSWVALNTQTANGGMQDVNSATYQFNLPSNSNKYNLYRIEFTALNSDVMALADIRIYGTYFEQADSEKTYTVSFNTDGGSRVSSQDVRSGNKVSEPSNPTKDGYKFTGWYTSRSLTSYYDFNRKVYEDMTLYAGWTAKTVDNDAQLRAQKEAEEAKKQQQAAEAARVKAEQDAAAEKARLEQAQKDAAAEKARLEQAQKEAEAAKAQAAAAEAARAEEQQKREAAEENQKQTEEVLDAVLDTLIDESNNTGGEEEPQAQNDEPEALPFSAAPEPESSQESDGADDPGEVGGEGDFGTATVTGNGGAGAVAGFIVLIAAAAGGLVFWKKKKSGTTEE